MPDPLALRHDVQADGSPAIRIGLLLGEQQAREFVAWYNSRQAEAKANHWRDWNPGDMAARTLCVQIEAFWLKAFPNTERP